MRGVDRRTFLKTTGLASAAVAATGRTARGHEQDDSPASRTAPALAAGTPDIIVVGAGAFGAWTALYLRERGVKVTLVDAFGPGNPRATSGGETRQIRVGYGDREMYSRWVITALERWEAREREWNRRLLYRAGRLQLAPQWSPELEAEKRVFDRLGVKYEVIQHDDLRRRHPQMNPEGMNVGFLEPGAAVVKAREAIIMVAGAFEQKGGSMQIARALPARAAGRRMEALAIGADGRLAGGTFVFACGPWLRKVFPELLGTRISTPRREVFFFGTPSGDTRFTWPNMPNWSEATYYGFPSIDSKGFKVCPIGGSLQMDPDTDERIVSPDQVKRAYDYVALRFPGLKGQPIVETRVCQLENTPDEHFLIDRHPDFDNVWIAGGGSGHGFKHGPVVGEYIADRAMGLPGEPTFEQAFRLKREGSKPHGVHE